MDLAKVYVLSYATGPIHNQKSIHKFSKHMGQNTLGHCVYRSLGTFFWNFTRLYIQAKANVTFYEFKCNTNIIHLLTRLCNAE